MNNWVIKNARARAMAPFNHSVEKCIRSLLKAAKDKQRWSTRFGHLTFELPRCGLLYSDLDDPHHVPVSLRQKTPAKPLIPEQARFKITVTP
jgi:hypothetical protein